MGCINLVHFNVSSTAPCPATSSSQRAPSKRGCRAVSCPPPRPPLAPSTPTSPLSFTPPSSSSQSSPQNGSRYISTQMCSFAGVSAAATLAIIILTVALIRHRPRGGRTSDGRTAVGGKGGFNPDKELFYLDTFTLGLLGQISGTKQSSGKRRGRGRRRGRALLTGSPPTAAAAIDRASRCRCRKRKRKGCVCVKE
ncbi:hypothetical protein Taro_044971 [Colocasia esculenta]|uniref:Uncharacterized protein n=1 Tax=Colocasia esculenta TaxID=4460 RepID=A0A843WZA8_COLES|nr:hypothetical protein [Colocasia esculenta]